jgi:hypothetical protein
MPEAAASVRLDRWLKDEPETILGLPDGLSLSCFG